MDYAKIKMNVTPPWSVVLVLHVWMEPVSLSLGVLTIVIVRWGRCVLTRFASLILNASRPSIAQLVSFVISVPVFRVNVNSVTSVPLVFSVLKPSVVQRPVKQMVIVRSLLGVRLDFASRLSAVKNSRVQTTLSALKIVV